jgi:hypothetical protein
VAYAYDAAVGGMMHIHVYVAVVVADWLVDVMIVLMIGVTQL